MSDEQQEEQSSKRQGRGFLALLQSTLAALFGIQSERKRQADFNKGDPGLFITMGIIALVLLVVTMILVVNGVLESASK